MGWKIGGQVFLASTVFRERAEIKKLDDTGIVKTYICRLQVSMDNSVTMQVDHSQSHAYRMMILLR